MKERIVKDEAYYQSLDKRSKEYREYKKGLGDKIKDVTEALGIKQCEACKKRQQKLNNLSREVKYLFSKANDFTPEDRKLWEQFRNRDSSVINKEEIDLIIRLSFDVLNVSIKACSSCSYKVYEKWVNRLNSVFEK